MLPLWVSRESSRHVGSKSDISRNRDRQGLYSLSLRGVGGHTGLPHALVPTGCPDPGAGAQA